MASRKCSKPGKQAWGSTPFAVAVSSRSSVKNRVGAAQSFTP